MTARRRKPSSVLVLAAVMVAVTACSLVVDTSGLAGPDLVEAGEASGPDASDAATSPDGQPDGPAGRGCDATFCDDFDEGGVAGRWSSEEITTTGSVVLDDIDSTTKPNALHVRLSSPSRNDYRYAVLRKTFSVARAFACELDVKVLKRPTEAFVDLLRFETSGGPLAKHWLWFGMSPDAAVYREDRFYGDGGCDCPVKASQPPGLEVGKWTHVRFQTDLTRARISYDGTLVLDEPIVTFAASTPVIFSLGASGYATSQSEVLYDGLECQVGP
jgi:hypothetical protein